MLGWGGTAFTLGHAGFAVLVKYSGGKVKQVVRSVDLGIRRDVDIKDTDGH